MKFLVHFTTIPPRFKHLEPTIISWLNQSVAVDRIVISVAEHYRSFAAEDLSLLRKYQNDFGKVEVQILPQDFGPSSKLIGALSYVERTGSDAQVIVCDDDLRYDIDVVKSYVESLSYGQGCIMTHFKVCQRCPGINYFQGADSYLLPQEFFRQVSFAIYQKYLERVHAECPDCFFQDDYVLTYYVARFTDIAVKSVMNRKPFRQGTSISELHLHPLVHARERNIIDYFSGLAAVASSLKR